MRPTDALHLFVLLACSAPAAAAAQQSREQVDIPFAKRCQDAAAALATARLTTASERALIGQCAVAGPPAVSQRWKDAPDDREELSALVEWSSQLRTPSVLSATTAVAGDPGRPRQVRLAALASAVGYLDSGYRVSLRGSPGAPAARLVRAFHPQVPTVNEIPPGVATGQVLDVMRAVAGGDPDTEVQAAGLAVWQDLAEKLPDQAGIEPTMFTVLSNCDGRFTVSSSLPIAVSVRLVIDGIPKAYARIQPGQAAKLDLAVRDSFTIMFAEKRMGSAVASRLPCS